MFCLTEIQQGYSPRLYNLSFIIQINPSTICYSRLALRSGAGVEGPLAGPGGYAEPVAPEYDKLLNKKKAGQRQRDMNMRSGGDGCIDESPGEQQPVKSQERQPQA